MTSRTTRTLLVAVPLSIWFLLVGVTAGLSADGRPPSGGMFTIAVGLAITSSAVAIAVWARGDAKAHVSAELQDVRVSLQDVRVNLSSDLAMFYKMMSRRIDSLDSHIDSLDMPTQPLPKLAAVGMATVSVPVAIAPPADNVLAFKMGQRFEREHGQT